MPSFTSGVAEADPDLEARLRVRLDEVEKQLVAAVHDDDGFIDEAAGHLLAAGGKRFRPLLVLLAAEFGDAGASDIAPAAVVIELTHLATLYHDDVMDEAALRRGAASANARWDNSIAILTGDYLFAVASRVVADLGPDAVRIQAETFQRLVHGQIHETIGPREGQDRLRHYLDVVADKTGSLVATAARFGAMTSGAPTAVVEALTEFGERIGVAFQLADDVIDIASESADSGKTPGTDLREGVPTLATLLVQAEARPEDARLLELLAGPITDDAEHAEALTLLRANPALDRARALVRQEADEARALLDGLADVPARAALASLCDRVVDRLG
ncbi:heptaprenyl diphosphate synthase [Mumia flava]|uniref:Heptaprenyl diphosphate synthase n=1 Tax=Mumia flava TaxID=1348852 RepID=A0A0B2BEF2_9ACTN|nr:polyprenyl synthetase family protein [Mumia flava]PJJ58258.1 heptaprenyl diphosphate synthase [Mumia flava]